MQNNLLTWTTIFLVGIIILNTIIILQLRKLKKEVDKQNFPDERYWELKLRIHALITTVIIVGAAIVFLGWNIRSQISSELKTEVLVDTRDDIRDAMGSADSLGNVLDSLKEKVKSFSSSYLEINSESIRAQGLLSDLNNEVDKLDDEVQKRISDIKTLLKIYVVPDIRWKKNQEASKRFYFKDMKPVNSSSLPLFSKPPSILILGNYKVGAVITDLTREYVELLLVSTTTATKSDEIKDHYSLTFWVVEL
jgi:hypothetical protein